MAITSAFKVQCPSCEAKVTVRDPGLAGKKIDCPKCKFRFVVEVPVEANGQTTEEIPVKKGAGKPPEKSRSVSKNKPLPKGDDDEEKGGKKKKKKGSNSTLLIGGGIGVLAIAVLVIAWMTGLFGGDDATSLPGKPPGQTKVKPKDKDDQKGDPNLVDNKVDPDKDKKELPKAKQVDLVKSDITNMLPDDAKWVFRINGREFLDTPIGGVFFEKSGDSARAFRRQMGFAGEDVESFVCSIGADGSLFSVVRLKTDLKIEELKAAMELDAKVETILKRDLWMIKSNELLNMLGDYLSAKIKTLGLTLPRLVGQRSLALCLTDPQTLVIADQPGLKKFLLADLKRKFQTAYSPPEDSSETKKDGDPNAPAEDPNAPKNDRPAHATNPSFLSVDPALKIMINQLETKDKAVLAFAGRISDSAALLKRINSFVATPNVALPGSPLIGLVIRKMDDEKLNAVAAVEFARPDAAQQTAQNLQIVAAFVAKYLTDLLQLQVGVGGGDPNMPMPMNPPKKGGGGARLLDDGDQQTFVFFQEGKPGVNKKDSDAPAAPSSSTISITATDKFLLITLDIEWKPIYYLNVSPAVRSKVDLLKGEALMMTGRAHFLSLGGAAKGVEGKGETPPAAFSRPAGAGRFGMDVPPEQRVSWMVDLLPYLGYETLGRSKVKRDEAWNSEANLIAGSAWVPEFLSKDYPAETWRAHVPSLQGRDLGATHFVGLSGVGMDAANYPDTPEFAKKLGLFGYSRQTKFADISDGAANTIFMIQVPPNIQRPWIRGGGATVQGTPLQGSIKPFVCVERNGQKGTHVVMADGSIRFLSETIDDKIFQALTTYKGGEKVDNLDALAPAEKKDVKLEGPKK